MIIAVCGGKGGVGKSTVALNLGATLDGVVVDADVGMADLPTDGGPTLHDVLAGRIEARAAVREDWAVAILPSGRSLAGARAADRARFPPTLQVLDEAFGWVVIDVPAGFDADAALPIASADAAVIVTLAEPTALADAVRTRSMARETGTGIGAVAVNRTRDPVEAVEDTLGGPLFTVRESSTLSRAQRQGLPVAFLDATAPVSRDLTRLARELTRLRRDTRLEA
ncbi:MAG: MinD/ParA family protein [Halodesulfurarchaeum sp.]